MPSIRSPAPRSSRPRRCGSSRWGRTAPTLSPGDRKRMDLHFTAHEPDPEEMEAVDRRLAGLPLNGHRRQYLLPVLHAIQDRKGWISPGALNYACQRLEV